MKLIFWNCKNVFDVAVILDILIQEDPEVIFLAEAEREINIDEAQIVELAGYEYFENPGCRRIRIIKKMNFNAVLSRQSDYYSAIKYEDKVIVSVHLPSQMFQHMDALKGYFRDLRGEIDAEFGNSVKKDIVLIGDFNVNPFEKPLIDFDGFCASNSIKLNKEASSLKKKRELYYNPTWMLYNNTKFPGTKYYKRPSASAFDILEHHFLDQVIVSYSLSQKIKYQNIVLLERTANYTFYDASTNSVKISDHLPLVYEFKTIE